MSLHWDCENCDTPTAADDLEANTRQCLVFESLCVNLNEITAENEEEWMFRSMLLQQVDGSSIVYETESWEEKAGFLRAALRRWRGMTTNAEHKTRKQWMSKTMELLEKEVLRQLPKAEEVSNATCP